MKLKIKIPLSIALLVLIGFAVITIAMERVVHGVLERDTLSNLASKVHSDAELVKVGLEADLSQLWEIANRTETRSMDVELIRKSLRSDISRIDVLELGLVFPDGTTYYVNDNNTTNLGDRDYVKTAFSGENTVFNLLISRATG